MTGALEAEAFPPSRVAPGPLWDPGQVHSHITLQQVQAKLMSNVSRPLAHLMGEETGAQGAEELGTRIQRGISREGPKVVAARPRPGSWQV